ncbi:hypothetical protein KUCAC02_027749 [Chaenocephalus aceratus]|uniref:Uncharacterized protein n=1 Tax=Chaenocephalus aceratus TaxID=36190 RepID=A0ACB9W4Y9_CHAAC|nr:hypothetical protein KUCAC02_027749 [Chaenocephalus aceratus]
MAREFNLLRLLLVVACLVPTTITAESTTNTTAVTNTTTTAVPTTITAESTTNTTAVPTTITAEPTTNTPAVTNTTTTAVTITTTAVPTTNTPAVTNTTTTAVTITTTAVPTTNTTAVTTTTTTAAAVTTTTTTAGPTTTMLPNPCNENSCGAGATCEPRANQTFACLCLTGDFYNDISKTCDSAKVFPGKLVLLQIDYKEVMDDKKSPEFLHASIRITDELTRVFQSEYGYSGSIVLKLSQIPKVGNPGYSEVTSTFWSRASTGVSADVQIIFEANADIVTDEVTAELVKQKDCGGCLLNNSTFVGRELCVESDTPCGQNTACTSGNGTFTCICLPGYITTIYSERICIACPSGQTSVGSSNTCVFCSFGYSGFKCGDSWKLSLVIVGSVLGALLLITLIVLIVVAVRSTKKKSCKKADTGNSYVSQLPVKAPLGAHSHVAPANGLGNGQSAFGNAGVPRIPRATTTSSLDSRTNLEMTQSNSRQNLIPAGRNSRFYEDNEDQYAQSRQSSLYARPQNTPYSQSRPQNNPYAQSQGHSSPYMH